jgi:cardiolipin synthase
MIATVVLTVLATTFVIVVSINFHRPEKLVRHDIRHCYTLADRQFRL